MRPLVYYVSRGPNVTANPKGRQANKASHHTTDSATNMKKKPTNLLPSTPKRWHSSSTFTAFFSHQSNALLTPSMSIEPCAAAAVAAAAGWPKASTGGPLGDANADAALSATRSAN